MPSVTSNYGGITQTEVCAATFKLFHRAIEDLALHLHSLAVARVEMFSQTPRFLSICRIEQIDDGARRVHATGGIYAWADAKAKVVRVHFCAIAATGNIDQRAQAVVHSFRQI